MTKKWKVTKSEYVVDRPWLRARRDSVLLPTGVEYPEYYVLEYPDWVNVIALTAEGRFVMVEQYRHGLGAVQTELCAGVIEAGETPLEAAKRELAEETGYTGGTWEPFTTISGNPSTTNNLTHCFIASGVELTRPQALDSTEDISVKILSQMEVVSLLMNDEIKQSLMAAPLWKYFALKHPKALKSRK
ncbi:MAG: NUDIX hydrolase [Muribaculaceae bacterium]|nr:NUDIX hydrolase [Muribaculaceae bacterium]